MCLSILPISVKFSPIDEKVTRIFLTRKKEKQLRLLHLHNHKKKDTRISFTLFLQPS